MNFNFNLCGILINNLFGICYLYLIVTFAIVVALVKISIIIGFLNSAYAISPLFSYGLAAVTTRWPEAIFSKN